MGWQRSGGTWPATDPDVVGQGGAVGLARTRRRDRDEAEELQEAEDQEDDEPGSVVESRGVDDRADPGDELPDPAGDDPQTPIAARLKAAGAVDESSNPVTSGPSMTRVPVASAMMNPTATTSTPATMAIRLPRKILVTMALVMTFSFMCPCW